MDSETEIEEGRDWKFPPFLNIRKKASDACDFSAIVLSCIQKRFGDLWGKRKKWTVMLHLTIFW